MKKLNLNVAHLGATEILTREELKLVLGGTDATGTGSKSDSYCNNFCTKDSDCGTTTTSVCPYCNTTANWGGKKVCEKTNIVD